jgi:hypothetical protein
METKSLDAGAFVFDLLSNSTLRFEQFDGTMSLPFKSNGKFHYGGKVLVASNDLFKKLVVSILPILKAKGDKPCVILPPLPRSLFSQCCNDKNHCTNKTDKGFSEELITGYIRLRNELIKQLVSHGLSSFKVMDICCMTQCSKTVSTAERLRALRVIMAKDDTHFLEDGYKNLAERCMNCLRQLSDDELSRKVSLTFGGDSKAHVGPQRRGWLLVFHPLAVETPSGEMQGGAREGRSGVTGVDYITPTRDGNPSCLYRSVM